jgi:hypothetical protein
VAPASLALIIYGITSGLACSSARVVRALQSDLRILYISSNPIITTGPRVMPRRSATQATLVTALVPMDRTPTFPSDRASAWIADLLLQGQDRPGEYAAAAAYCASPVGTIMERADTAGGRTHPKGTSAGDQL